MLNLTHRIVENPTMHAAVVSPSIAPLLVALVAGILITGVVAVVVRLKIGDWSESPIIAAVGAIVTCLVAFCALFITLTTARPASADAHRNAVQEWLSVEYDIDADATEVEMLLNGQKVLVDQAGEDLLIEFIHGADSERIDVYVAKDSELLEPVK